MGLITPRDRRWKKPLVPVAFHPCAQSQDPTPELTLQARRNLPHAVFRLSPALKDPPSRWKCKMRSRSARTSIRVPIWRSVQNVQLVDTLLAREDGSWRKLPFPQFEGKCPATLEPVRQTKRPLRITLSANPSPESYRLRPATVQGTRYGVSPGSRLGEAPVLCGQVKAQ
jgi:hypothetical protein